jgi:signal transduction histidine kinase
MQLTEGIRAIGNKNYDQRIHIESEDELGEMARAFNTMAKKLDDYEHSNLAQILFEKTRAEAVINSLQDASVGVDSNGIVLFANEQALQLLHLQSSEIIGKPAAEVARRNDLFKFILNENQTAAFKIVIDNKEHFFVKEVNEIIKDKETLGKVYVLNNVTTFQEKDIAKTNFLATISHELKTPLASTDIGLKLLENPKFGTLQPEQQNIINDLKKDNQRLIKLVSELLDVTQVETGNVNLHIDTVAVRDVIDYAIQTVKNQANEKKVSITVEVPDDVRFIKADKEKAAWVLVNLLSNAVRYSPEQDVVKVHVEQTANDYIQLSVADRGSGIPVEYQSKLFQRFFTVPGSQQGSGLGLAISKEFMEAMGGTIQVQSAPGEGATFLLRFKNGSYN